VVARHRWNNEMRRRGVYRAVEYRILRLYRPSDGVDVESARAADPDVYAWVEPVGRLLPRFDRVWPVEVALTDARLVPYGQDLAVCVLTTLLCAGILISFVAGFTPASIYVIPTLSMSPTLARGDAIVVNKLTSTGDSIKVGDVVFFSAPPALQNLVIASGEPPIPPRTLLVKRVAAVAGDRVAFRDGTVRINDRAVSRASMYPPWDGERVLAPGELFVLGDNRDHSVDSRTWGILQTSSIRGRPIFRCWPPQRSGSLTPFTQQP